MSTFSTQRPVKSTKLADALESARVRRRNMQTLRETVATDAVNKETEKDLEKMDSVAESTSALSYERSKVSTKVSQERLNKSIARLEHRLVMEGIDKLMENIMFELVYESFWMDDEMKSNMVSQIFEGFRETIHMMEAVGVQESSQDSPLIANLKDIATESAKKVAHRIVEEVKSVKDTLTAENVDNINFSINDDESMELDNNLAELGKEDIEQLVKQKVLSVVQDEQRAGKEKSDMFKEMDEAVKAEADTMNTEDDETPEDGEAPAKESLEVKINRIRRNKLNKSVGSTLFESMMVYSTKHINENIAMEGITIEAPEKMGAVFNDSLLKYTVMETLNTIGMYKFTSSNVRQLSQYLIKN